MTVAEGFAGRPEKEQNKTIGFVTWVRGGLDDLEHDINRANAASKKLANALAEHFGNLESRISQLEREIALLRDSK